MKKIVSIVLLSLVMACNGDLNDYQKPENGLDAGREFINNSLKGRFTTARKYMLQTEENNYWLNKVSTDYNQYSEKDKTGYSSASINISQVSDVVPDSVVMIDYSNSYIKRPQKLKVVKYNGVWQVDLSYTFSAK